MGKVTPIRPRRPVVSGDTLAARLAQLRHNFADRGELIGGTPYVFERLAEIVPESRRDELSHAIFYVTHVLDLTQANLLAVLTCAMVLRERYLAEAK
jgi:hypothetical protein